jgi:hypothetical protein
MANGTHIPETEDFLRNVPGANIWEKTHHLILAEQEAALRLARIKALNLVAKTMISEDRKVQRFLAARTRYQEQFGFGMSVQREGATTQ